MARPTHARSPGPVRGFVRADPARERAERLPRWISAAATVLVHLALVALLLVARPVPPTSDEGTAGGGRTEVTFIDRPHPVPSPPPPAAAPATRVPEPARPAPVERPDPSRLHVVEVQRADQPLPAEAPPTVQPPAAPPAPTRQLPRDGRHAWGQPPGLQVAPPAPDPGPAPGPPVAHGRRHRASSSEPGLDAGGFQVVYDLVADTRLRSWRDAGMTEISMPLPGIRQFMVCPLETALRRESGPCRLVEPDDPALAAIGDAREVIAMNQVYRRGELVWRGPAPYR